MFDAMSSVALSLTVGIDGRSYMVDTSTWIDLSLPITDRATVRAFHLPPASFVPFRMGSFIGSVEEGGPVRCDVVTLAPHGDGTHTECVGHVGGKGYSVLNAIDVPMMVAEIITVPLRTIADGDRVIMPDDLRAAWRAARTDVLIVRTSPNDVLKKTVDHSGTNPAYVAIDAMQVIVDRGVRHLLIDLPSVDREEDGGALAAHKLFWDWPAAPRTDKTITELIYVPDTVADGLYALALNVAPFDGDAAPSRPMIARYV
ncbi:MAG: cyclase family protein [Candidatus Kapabacteria bacterium]|nr:cyclase family protein [Candidatus Kapabacteria bacterium]